MPRYSIELEWADKKYASTHEADGLRGVIRILTQEADMIDGNDADYAGAVLSQVVITSEDRDPAA